MCPQNCFAGVVFWALAQYAYAQGAPPPGLPPGAAPCGGGYCVGGAVVYAGSVQMLQSTPIDAARAAAANPDQQKTERRYSEEGEFVRSMGIQIQGEGVAVPPDFNTGGRVTLFNDAKQAGDGKAAPETAERESPSAAKASSPDGQDGKRDGSDSRERKDAKSGDRSDLASAGKRNRRDASLPECTGVGEDGSACIHGHRLADPVADRINRGLERNPGVAGPMDMRVKETGIAVPECTEQSREGLAC